MKPLFFTVSCLNRAAVGRKRLTVLISMGKHLLLAPIDGLAETVGILKHGIVANCFSRFPCFFVLNQPDFDFLVQRVKFDKFAVLDSKDIQLLVLARSDSKLNIALIAKLELRHFAALPVVERNHVILPKLRGRGKLQAFAQQRSGKDALICALLKSGVRLNRRHNSGNEALAVLAADDLIDTLLDCIPGEIGADAKPFL